MSNTLEQTLSIIKPDAVERNLENEIKEMFKNRGFKILKEKKVQIEKSEAEKFYKVHETKPFYNDLCAYLASGPIVVMILEKQNAVLDNRDLMGATNPKDADENTLSSYSAADLGDTAAEQDTAYGNAFTLGQTINEGDTIIKYGHDIGKVVKSIKKGEHVHVHNVKTKKW